MLNASSAKSPNSDHVKPHHVIATNIFIDSGYRTAAFCKLDSLRAKIQLSCAAYPEAIETIKTRHFTEVLVVGTTIQVFRGQEIWLVDVPEVLEPNRSKL
jgi:hypothetical protein